MSRKRMALGISMYVVLIAVWIYVWNARYCCHSRPLMDHNTDALTDKIALRTVRKDMD